MQASLSLMCTKPDQFTHSPLIDVQLQAEYRYAPGWYIVSMAGLGLHTVR